MPEILLLYSKAPTRIRDKPHAPGPIDEPYRDEIGEKALAFALAEPSVAGARGDLTIFDVALAALGPGMPVVSLPLH